MFRAARLLFAFPRSAFFLAVLLFALLVHSPCSAQGLLFLRIESIEGQSEDPNRPGWFDIGSLSFAASRPVSTGGSTGGGGRTSLSELTVTRQSDATSPVLLHEAAAGEGRDVELELVKSTEDRRRYYRLRLRNTLISSYSQSSGGDVPSESITFNFTRLDLTYTEYLLKGATETTAWFDLEKQTGGETTSNGVNTAPSVSTIQSTNTLEDTAFTIPFTASDLESAALAYSATTSDAALLPLANITFGGSGTNRTIRLMPATNQYGTANISVIVSDGAASTTRSFALLVTPVNDPPLVAAIPAQVTISNTPTTIPVGISDVDNPAPSLICSAFSAAGFPIPVFEFGGTPEARSLTITPPTGFVGALPITVVAFDGSLFGSNSFTLNVVASGTSNRPPSLTLNDSTPLAAIAGRWIPMARLQGSDPDAGSSPVSLHIAANGAFSISNAAGLSISNNGGSAVMISGPIAALNATLASTNGLSYRAPTGAAGMDIINFTLNDHGANGSGGPLEAQATLSVQIFRSGLHQWQHAHFTSSDMANPALEGTLWGANADPDADGLENLAEYGLDTDPRSASHARPSAGRVMENGAAFLSVAIPRRLDPDLQLDVMVGSEIGGDNWTGDSAAVTVSTPLNLQNGFELIRYTDTTPVSDLPKRFMRIRWSYTPAN